MAVVDAVISFAVEKIGNFIIQEAKFLSEVSCRVEELKAELIRMRCFLEDAESRQGNHMGIRNWIAEIRDIAYDAEDVLEIYALKAASGPSCSPCTCFAANNPNLLHEVGSKIDRLAARLTKSAEGVQTYGIRELKERERPSSSSEEHLMRRTYSHMTEQNVVGLEDDTSSLLTKLVDPDNYRVVSICGMGGLGKTTLAKKVYHRCRVGGHFEFFIWVFVSQKWQTRNIWETLLRELISPKERGDDRIEKEFEKKWKKIQEGKDQDVAKQLRDELEKSKCLVVLDDIWDVDAWEKLKPGFPEKEMNTKFIITTRNRNVALGADPNRYIHVPQCLNPVDSWELFEKTAMPRRKIHAPAADSSVDKNMEELGREMVKHCGGLPLAIVVLAGLLSAKTTYDQWHTVHECIKSYLRGEANGLKIFPLLALSFDDLPYKMKPCFLYWGVLPEDFLISTDRLINLWVAEGLVSSRGTEREGEEALEDVGYRSLTALADRYMVQVEKRDTSGRIKKCKMHDLMRDFCLSKAEDAKFFQVVPLFGKTKSLDISSSSSPATVTGRVRRLSVHLSNFPGNVALECEKYPPFRSVLGFSLDGHSGLSQPLLETFIHRFKLLRVLDLERVKGFAIPKTIGKLIHLRFLNLRSAWVGNLEIRSFLFSNLSCLLTLRLDPSYSARRLPDVLWKLKKLRHLYLPRNSGDMKTRLQFAALSDLRTLVNFPASKAVADVKDLIALTNLRKLKIVISDEISLQRFKGIIPVMKFNHLRDFSIQLTAELGPQDVTNIGPQDVTNIKSRCPRLLRLKENGVEIYRRGLQMTTDLMRKTPRQICHSHLPYEKLNGEGTSFDVSACRKF